jgi:UDPglucose--hexose-1-phosphate uridylyltransferase
MPEFRKDPVSARCVIVSTERAKRPQSGFPSELSGREETCPFCTGNEQETPPEVLAYREDGSARDGPGWSVRVVPNKYPALTPDAGSADHQGVFYKAWPGIGAHEVVIESPQHATSTASLEARQFAAVMRAYRERMSALAGDERWRSIIVYKNEGREAGATLEHVHSQIVALPEVPPVVAAEMENAQRHYAANGRCLFCELVGDDVTGRARLIETSRRFTAFCPYASRFPFETWIAPKTHAACFEHSTEDELAELGAFVGRLLRTLTKHFPDLPFNYIVHSAPLRENAAQYFHWHLEIMPRLAQAAGFEWGSGLFINPISPEDAALLLRGAGSGG